MANNTGKRISANEAVKDIRSGMTGTDLMAKYGLSPNELKVLFEKLANAGLLEPPGSDLQNGRRNATVREHHREQTLAGMPRHGAIAVPAQGHQYPAGIGPIQRQSAGNRYLDEMYDSSAETVYDDALDSAPEVRRMERTQWVMLLVTPLVALLCFVFFWPRWILDTFRILIHEMGHAIFGWVFGYPSFPQFDIIFGGGLTRHFERNTVLLIAIYLGFGFLAYLYRNNRTMLIVLTVAASLHAIVSYTDIHSVIILFMGHGTELIIAGIFIFRCLSGRAVVHPAERPLYGVIGFFILFFDFRFAFGLLTSASRVKDYLGGKGDLDNDFVRIAHDHLHVSLSSVVGVFFLCCILCLLLSFLAFRYMEHFHAALASLLTRDANERDQARS